MGRGRAKAKQTKVARQLKYQPAGDLDRLRSELGVSDPPSRSNGSRDHDLDDDRYAAYADYAEGAEEDEDDEEDDEDDSYPHR
jgi:Protein of unknown function (DUF3073)